MNLVKAEIEAIRNKAAEDAKKILGESFDPGKSDQLSKLLAPALEVISPAEVRELKGMTQIQAISQISATDIEKAEAAIEKISSNAIYLAGILSQPVKAARMRL